MPDASPSRFRVLIAGGGVAGLEAVLALRELLGDRVEVTVLTPEREFVYRPMAVGTPFGRGHAQRHRLADIADQLGVRLVVDRLQRVDDAAAPPSPPVTSGLPTTHSSSRWERRQSPHSSA